MLDDRKDVLENGLGQIYLSCTDTVGIFLGH